MSETSEPSLLDVNEEVLRYFNTPVKTETYVRQRVEQIVKN